MRTTLDFLNTTKYPPSLMFTLMTLGPAAIFCAYAERWRGWLKDTLVMFGRVPFAFYVVHWYLLHALSVLLGVMQGFPASAAHWTCPGAYPRGIRRVTARACTWCGCASIVAAVSAGCAGWRA